MSRRLNTRTAFARDFAARLKRGEAATADDIAWLEGFGEGRKNGREADGFTAYIKKQAALWLNVQARLRSGDEGEVCADFLAANPDWNEDRFWDFVARRGYDEMSACLRTQNKI
jgi:hypothetical protein